jgi:hypothetical protein
LWSGVTQAAEQLGQLDGRQVGSSGREHHTSERDRVRVPRLFVKGTQSRNEGENAPSQDTTRVRPGKTKVRPALRPALRPRRCTAALPLPLHCPASLPTGPTGPTRPTQQSMRHAPRTNGLRRSSALPTRANNAHGTGRTTRTRRELAGGGGGTRARGRATSKPSRPGWDGARVRRGHGVTCRRHGGIELRVRQQCAVRGDGRSQGRRPASVGPAA